MILVIGCGFVGETVAKSLEENGQEVVRIDPKYNDNKIADYKDEAVCAIVAVPTPTSNDENSPYYGCLLYTSPSPRDPWKSRMPSSA